MSESPANEARSASDAGRITRIGAVSYLNTCPLIHGLERDTPSGIRLSADVPSVLAGRLSRGDVDVALLPVIELGRIAGTRLLPGLGIACRGPVRSVVLVAKRPLAEVRRVALDPESCTSNALVRVLFAGPFGGSPEFVRPGDAADAPLAARLEEFDAVVRIGDKALRDEADRPAGVDVHDLGEAWMSWTGLPFVFAGWVARGGVDLPMDLPEILDRSYESGRAAIDTIARELSDDHGVSEATAYSYLTESIRFRIGAEEMAGLRRFLELAAAAGLIDSVPPDLSIARDAGDVAVAASGGAS